MESIKKILISLFLITVISTAIVPSGVKADQTLNIISDGEPFILSWDGVCEDVEGNPENIAFYIVEIYDDLGVLRHYEEVEHVGACDATQFSSLINIPPGYYMAVVRAVDASGNESEDSEPFGMWVPDCTTEDDANGDGDVDISDAITILGWLFLGQPIPCPSNTDHNDDGAYDISDVISLLGQLFG